MFLKVAIKVRFGAKVMIECKKMCIVMKLGTDEE